MHGTSSSGPRVRYLAGLRGLAAIAVVNSHLPPVLILASDAVAGDTSRWGSGRDLYRVPAVAMAISHWDILTSPILKLVYGGNLAVALFFVCGGYTLSLRWVLEMSKQPRNPQSAFQSLSSTAFRRPFRLLAAPAVSMLLSFLLVKTSFMRSTIARDRGFTEMKYYLEQFDLLPDTMHTWTDQLADLAADLGRLFLIFLPTTDPGYRIRYNLVLWTIKLELRASIVLVATQISLFYVARRTRLLCLTLLCLLGFAVHAFECPLFWAGWLVAELQNTYTPTNHHWPLYQTLFFVGCYLGSFPEFDLWRSTAFSWLGSLTPFAYEPKERFWVSMGAILMMYSIDKLPAAKRLCESPIPQYLGKIRFSIYLTHLAIFVSLGPEIFRKAWEFTGQDNLISMLTGFALGYTVILALVLHTAEMFWWVVDRPLMMYITQLQHKWFTEIGGEWRDSAKYS